MKYKKPGLRIVKTWIAVTLSMMISYFRPGESLPFYSAIAAIICLKPNFEGTRDVGVNRIIGTMIGGLAGLLYLLIVPVDYLPMPIELLIIGVIDTLLIWMMAMADRPKAVSIMAIVFLSITINHGNEGNVPFTFAFNRTFDTMIGVITAIVVNWTHFEFKDRHPHKQIEEKN